MRPEIWKGTRVLITGHTGFKGSWLTYWLSSAGANVFGMSLPESEESLFASAHLGELVETVYGDIRDYHQVRNAFDGAKPDVVLHLAAQALVRPSYADPIGTYATNVMGTLHVLEAAKHSGCRAAVVVTSDKCYENKEWEYGYREIDEMGGYDPYSSSKGCAELLTRSWRRSFVGDNSCVVASARAGNVIGGGDFATDRLVPDLMRGFATRRPVLIRRPRSVRPWQHVLEPLAGYVELAERMLEGDYSVADAWNFGPDDSDTREVGWVATAAAEMWGDGATWKSDSSDHPHEANLLRLDCGKARAHLLWRPRWEVREALRQTVRWYRAYYSRSADVRELLAETIEEYDRSRISD